MSDKCTGLHRFLLVEEWTGMGATVSCITCEKTFHLDYTALEENYYPFQYFSGKHGPEGDKTVFILGSLV